MRRFFVITGWLLAMFLLGAGCASSGGSSLSDLRARVSSNPQDGEALRDLGVAEFENSLYADAARHLREAYKANPQDPQTRLYLGLSAEFDGKNEAALALYRTYTETPRTSPYRDRLEGRYRWLSREIIREDIQKAVKQDRALTDVPDSEGRLAVMPLRFLGGEDRLRPLGRGLSEMIQIDLAQVPDLKLVERIRVQALLDELHLSASNNVETENAPRMGRILGFGKVVQGGYTGLSDERIRLDVATVDINSDRPPVVSDGSDRLENLFRLEKEVVFGIIDGMGIALTPAQRREIEFFPTNNLLAFLAYSLGLQEEDAGRYDDAAAHFAKAASLDPQFTLAAERAQSVRKLATMRGPVRRVVSALRMRGFQLPDDIARTRRLRLLSKRLRSGFVPNRDSRRGASESARDGVGSFPDPPPPPASGGRGQSN
ncbi:MAG: tetratricopeptide repeat protein [Calditrichaeota bacterium]|nr:tetratricopeptide repeat protein [Calditrichota bacterium]